MHSYYNQDDTTSLNDMIDNNQIRIDEHGSMFMESPMLSDSVCPTNSIGCTNKSNEYSSTQQTGSHRSIHNEEKIHKCSTCNKCFTRKSPLNLHRRIHTGEKTIQMCYV